VSRGVARAIARGGRDSTNARSVVENNTRRGRSKTTIARVCGSTRNFAATTANAIGGRAIGFLFR
jgi:hypothetical protein